MYIWRSSALPSAICQPFNHINKFLPVDRLTFLLNSSRTFVDSEAKGFTVRPNWRTASEKKKNKTVQKQLRTVAVDPPTTKWRQETCPWKLKTLRAFKEVTRSRELGTYGVFVGLTGRSRGSGGAEMNPAWERMPRFTRAQREVCPLSPVSLSVCPSLPLCTSISLSFTPTVCYFHEETRGFPTSPLL